MQFMVDPGADATIGGMCACAASGTAAVKYGTMRENVMAMTVVLPPTTAATTTKTRMPDICHIGCNALKSSAGFNLPALLTGSEGTLGVITDVTVKLHPIPAHVIAASCAFSDLHSAANAVATIRMMGIPVSRIELLDEMSIQAFNHSLAMENDGVSDDNGGKIRLKSMDVTPTLFLEFASHSEAAALEDLAASQSICINDFGGSQFVSASDETTRKFLWAARHRLYYSAIALRSTTNTSSSNTDDDEGPTSQSTIVTDVCVPFSHFADIVSATAKDVRELGVVGPW
jgi:D-lactate dehydrogenase (cytochrome)